MDSGLVLRTPRNDEGETCVDLGRPHPEGFAIVENRDIACKAVGPSGQIG
jgi:hypothetical protein